MTTAAGEVIPLKEPDPYGSINGPSCKLTGRRSSFNPRPSKVWRKRLAPAKGSGGGRSGIGNPMDRPGGSSIRSSLAGLSEEDLVRWINDPSSCCAAELSQAFDPLLAQFPKPSTKDRGHGPGCNATCTACNPEAHITRRATTVLSKKYYTDSRAYLRARGRRYDQNLGAGAHVYGRSYYDASGGLLYNNGDIRRAGGLFGNLTCPGGCSRLPGGKSWGPCEQVGPESGGAPGIAKGRHVYKPNNRPFQVQGAVESSTRLERLKLNTINKAAKSAQIFGAAARNGSRYTGRAEAPRTVKSDWSLSVCRRLSQEKARCCRMVSEKLSTAPASRIPNASSGQRARCSNSGKTSFNRNQALLDALERDPDIFIDVPAEEDPSGKPPAPPPTLEEITASYFASDQFFIVDSLPYESTYSTCLTPACGPAPSWPLPGEGPANNVFWPGDFLALLGAPPPINEALAGQAPEVVYMYTNQTAEVVNLTATTCNAPEGGGNLVDPMMTIIRWNEESQAAAAIAAASWTSDTPSQSFWQVSSYADTTADSLLPSVQSPAIQIMEWLYPAFTGTPGSSQGECSTCPDLFPCARVAVEPGESILFVIGSPGHSPYPPIHGEGPVPGRYRLEISQAPDAPQPRAADQIIDLPPPGGIITVTGNTTDKELFPSEFLAIRQDNQHQFALQLNNVTAGTRLLFDTCQLSTNYDTYLILWDLANGTQTVLQTCDDDCAGRPEPCTGISDPNDPNGIFTTYMRSGNLTGTEELYLVVTGYANYSGDFEVTITVEPASDEPEGPGEPEGP